jgi:hypothetical protein
VQGKYHGVFSDSTVLSFNVSRHTTNIALSSYLGQYSLFCFFRLVLTPLGYASSTIHAMCSAVCCNDTSHIGSTSVAKILAANCGRVLAKMDEALCPRGKGEVQRDGDMLNTATSDQHTWPIDPSYDWPHISDSQCLFSRPSVNGRLSSYRMGKYSPPCSRLSTNVRCRPLWQ